MDSPSPNWQHLGRAALLALSLALTACGGGDDNATASDGGTTRLAASATAVSASAEVRSINQIAQDRNAGPGHRLAGSGRHDSGA